jgi:hypothetical protein
MKNILLSLLGLLGYTLYAQPHFLYAATDGKNGKPVITVEGDTVYIQTKKKLAIKKVYMFSLNNENTSFYITLVIQKNDHQQLVLEINQHYYRSGNIGTTNNKRGDKVNYVNYMVDKQMMDEISKSFHHTPNLRKHFGHQLAVEFIPLKDDYRAGDSVYVKLRITNTGSVPVYYNRGGMYRNSNGRCDYFNFDVYLNNILLPDEGPTFNFGGIETYPELKPGQTDSITECITKWTRFKEPGTYIIKCSYLLNLRSCLHDQPFPENMNNMHKRWDEKAEKTIEIVIEE